MECDSHKYGHTPREEIIFSEDFPKTTLMHYRKEMPKISRDLIKDQCPLVRR